MFRVQAAEFEDLRFGDCRMLRDQGIEFRVKDLRFMVHGLGSIVKG